MTSSGRADAASRYSTTTERDRRVSHEQNPDHLEQGVLWVIDPEAEEIRPLGSAKNPPLGSVLVHRWELAGQAGHVAAVHRKYLPWCPLVVVTPNGDGEIADLTAARLEWSRPGMPPRDAVLEAVTRRALPAPDEVAGHVARRLALPELRPLLTVCFDVSGTQPWRDLVDDRDSFYRMFDRYGPFNPRDWGSLARLVTLTSSQGREAVELAIRAGAVAALDLEISRLLGLDLPRFMARAGWEWVVEAALRRAGYLDGILPPAADDPAVAQLA